MTDKEQKVVFAKNLQRYLYESGKTQKEVADIIHVNAPTFNSWVKGVSIPRMGKVQRLADYFGISVTDLIDEHTPETTKKAPVLGAFCYLSSCQLPTAVVSVNRAGLSISNAPL